MTKHILVTAVAGSGKTTTCSELNKLGEKAIDIESIAGMYEVYDTQTKQVVGDYDNGKLSHVQRFDWNCKVSELRSLMYRQEADYVFYCGAMSNFSQIWTFFDRVIILQVSDETTRARLKTRMKGEFGSTEEVREWVFEWKDSIEREWLKLGAVVVDAESSAKEVAQSVIRASKQE